MKRIYLFLDYRDTFYSSLANQATLCSMDVPLLVQCFRDMGCEIVVKHYPEVNFREDDYRGEYILYQSSEDRGLQYRSYIEDILFGLHLQGAVLIPKLPYLRAHHNKVFMEILRDLSANPPAQTLRSRAYGTLEDFLKSPVAYPAVVKGASSAGSAGVYLLRTEADKIRIGRRVSRGSGIMEVLLELVHRKRRQGYTHRSLHRRKFIVQDFIPELNGDYRVLVFADKYFVVRRTNRKNDFRASGSGHLQSPSDVPPGLLDFAKSIFNGFDVPYISLDIAFDGQEWHLLEFQCVQFGPGGVQRSEHYFAQDAGKWVLIKGKSLLERECARSVMVYLQKLEQAADDSGRS